MDERDPALDRLAHSLAEATGCAQQLDGSDRDRLLGLVAGMLEAIPIDVTELEYRPARPPGEGEGGAEIALGPPGAPLIADNRGMPLEKLVARVERLIGWPRREES